MHRQLVCFVLFTALAVDSRGGLAVGPSELTSTDALVRTLVQQGATVTRAGAMPASTYPFFSVRAQRIVVDGADVQVFEYPTAARAESDAGRVSPTGTPIGQSQVSWMDTPNFYRRERLIVLYVGHSAQITTLLESTLGAPFAGGRQRERIDLSAPSVRDNAWRA